MPMDKYLIAPIGTGLETDLKPWLIPDDAFFQLQNAYVFRGRVRKRFGTRLMNGLVSDTVASQYSRLRINIGTTDAGGNFAGNVPGTKFNIGQMFSVGDEFYTVYQNGTPAAMLATQGSGTFDTTTGAVTITGAPPLTDVFWYPAQPVMGIIQYETAVINDLPTYAFDTQFAYQFVGGAWSRLGTAVWTGNDSQFFWGETWRGSTANSALLFVTNFNPPDVIKYWDSAAWTNFSPVYAAPSPGTNLILTARIIFSFKDRLVFLNTIETVNGAQTSFVNRCRFSQNGSPVEVDAWREDIPGKGGYIDASTKEQIITAEILKDRLIVFFSGSTWELVYTGNEILPFRWQKINTELGAESTFSIVPFDKVLLGIGNVGIHACNGANVERIDDKIPDEVFNIHNENEGVFRVNGIRDYYVEMVYWTFPSSEDDTQFNRVFPNRVLVYNYRTGAWAFNDDTITAFGYWQEQEDLTWQTDEDLWQEAEETWGSATLQAQFRQVLAGNQEGFMFIVDADETRNSPSLQITNLTYVTDGVQLQVINHNLAEGDFVAIENTNGINLPILTIYRVTSIIDADNFVIIAPDISGVYTGGGTIARVSNIDIITKQYNFYVKEDRNFHLARVDFSVDRTEHGAMTIDFFPSSSNVSLVTDGLQSGAMMGTSVLETSPYALIPLEQFQDRLWHPVYLQAEGECIQLRIYMSDDQMADPNISWSAFELHAMLFYCQPTSYRLQ